MTTTKRSFADIVSQSNVGRRRVSETLVLSPELAEEYQALSIEFLAAKHTEDREDAVSRDPEQAAARRAAAPPERESTKILKRMEALLSAPDAPVYEAWFEALDPDEWQALKTQHAPRDGNADDDGKYNASSFPWPAIEAALVDPEPTPQTMEQLKGVLSRGEQMRLVHVIWQLNEGIRQTPKAELLSSILNASATE